MMDKYFAFANAVQAMRRRAEALSNALGGALGVAAEPLPHQLASVRRILSETKIRHLIADEVGLGKTVQALMILNALRWQKPEHRAVIIAPERLLEQWNGECWTRAHVMTSIDPLAGDRCPVTLLRPADLTLRREDGGRKANLDPDGYDMLIVDEPQTMSMEVAEHIASRSEMFRQVLILSATPRLGEPRWRDLIMRMLEPEVAKEAVRNEVPIIEALLQREREMAALAQIEGPKFPLFQVAAANRRIIRNGRADWAHYLPRRQCHEMVVPANRTERLRFEVASTFPVMDDNEGTDRSTWTKVKLLQRSARSSRQLLRELAQIGGVAAELANDALTNSMDDPGDSRLEALLDLLSKEWANDEAQAFVIVCGDTPTMNLLEVVLPRYFPELKNRISHLARMSTTEAASEITFRRTREDLAPLLSGENRVLLVGEWVQAGLNLHHFARNIVFYSVPWNVVAIDQLIGRVDRLRPETIQGHRNKPQNIRIWRFVIEGSQEQAVVQVLSGTGVFECPLPPISEAEMEELYNVQADAARGFLPGNQYCVNKFDQGAVLPSSLTELDPWAPELAKSYWDSWVAGTIPGPTMSKPRKSFTTPTEASEEAMGHWLDLMGRSHDFQIGRRQEKTERGAHFSTLWYAEGGDRRAKPLFPLPDMATGRFRDDHKPFFHKRSYLSAPAIRTVATDEGEASERPLHFLDHGNRLHDALVNGYLNRGREIFGGGSVPQVVVRAPEGHPAIANDGTVLVSVGLIDPLPDTHLPEIWSEAAKEIRACATSHAQRTVLEREQDRLRDNYLAFQRWMRLNLRARLFIQGKRFEEGSWKPLEQEQLESILIPLAYVSEETSRLGKKKIWACGKEKKMFRLPIELITRERINQISSIQKSAQQYLSEHLANLEDRANEQLRKFQFELDRIISLRQAILEDKRAEEVSEGSQAMHSGMVAVAQREVEMAKIVRNEMLTFMHEILFGRGKGVSCPTISIVMSMVQED
ncbi:SNF2-related protein [Flexibacterium corallicola]|uniref:SNF2-related protein n=1 Tax=Flexibacterium corallicola TaxID=3037259 RepID=UPI00286ED039|nr:SNF2-related protein [Pseudovibrio sp. M1P-2-3]